VFYAEFIVLLSVNFYEIDHPFIPKIVYGPDNHLQINFFLLSLTANILKYIGLLSQIYLIFSFLRK